MQMAAPKGFNVVTSGLIGFLDPENIGIYAKIRSLEV